MTLPTWTLNQIVDNLNRNDVFWEGDIITYSFLETRPVEYIGGAYDFLAQNFNSFHTAQRAAATKAIELWDDIIAPSLVRTDSGDAGDIRFGNAAGLVGAGTFLPGNLDGHGGDVWFDNTDPDLNDARQPGDFGFFAFVHEFGHALGLEHPGDYNQGDGNGEITYWKDAEYRQDTLQYSAMSYFGAFEAGTDHYDADGYYQYAASPLLHDIAAVQAVYGADQTTRIGDTVYGFNSTADREIFDFSKNPTPVFAIWDAGGIDTLDFSGFSEGTAIRLGEGQFSRTPDMTNSIAIAYGAKIENAIGTQGNDFIDGNYLDNVINGQDGNDVIRGNGGNDTLIGLSGNDVISDRNGNDHLIGGEGNDRLSVENGHNTLDGGKGVDTIIGGIDVDVIFGGDDNDFIKGKYGDDTASGDGGDDYIDGEGGNDTLFGGAGDDTVIGEFGDDWIAGGEGDDFIDGGAGTDRIVFSGNFDDFEIVRDYTGAMTVTDLVLGDGDEGTDSIVGAEWLEFDDQLVAVSGIEIPEAPDLNLTGTAFNDTLSGYDGDDTISGYSGSDRLYGFDGDDFILGGRHNDTLFGGRGEDTLKGGHGDDRIVGNDGLDTASFDGKRSDYWITPHNGYVTVEYIGNDPAAYGGTDRVDADVERFQFSDGTWLTDDLPENSIPSVYAVASSRGSKLSGGDGDDTLIGRGGRDKMSGGAGDDLMIGGGSRDKMVGGDGNDSIYGGSGTDKIAGGAGDDYIDAGKHRDKVAGGAGNDTILGGKGLDKLIGEAGDDYIDGGKDKDKIAAGEGNDTVFGGKGTDKIAGQEGDDYIDGGKHDDKISGGAGNDTLIGGQGRDKVFGGEGDDVYIIDGKDKIGEAADEGIDTVLANFSYGLQTNFEHLVLTGESEIDGYGNAEDNVLTGNNGNNLLSGGAGQDTLMGGEGDDLLIGGDDADSFDFSLLVDSGSDTIGDFDRSADILRFSDVVDGAGDDISDLDAQIASIVNEGDGGDVRIDFNNGNSITFDDLGSGIAGNFGSIADVVDNASTQIVVTDLVGMAGLGFITQENQSNELSDQFTIVDRV